METPILVHAHSFSLARFYLSIFFVLFFSGSSLPGNECIGLRWLAPLISRIVDRSSSLDVIDSLISPPVLTTIYASIIVALLFVGKNTHCRNAISRTCSVSGFHFFVMLSYSVAIAEGGNCDIEL
jgi:hypothetical protein